MPKIKAFAPGRVEWLGNHTDYNQGFVLSAALDSGTSVEGILRNDGKIVLHSQRFKEDFRTNIKGLKPLPEKHWSNYVTGVVSSLSKHHRINGFEATINGNVPIGAGLASSASLTVAITLLLTKLNNISIDKLEFAKIAQAAEYEFAGVKCGLLDQISSIFGVKDQAMFIDFRSLKVETIEVPKGAVLVIVNSGVRHRLVSGEYNERRVSCVSAAKKLGKRYVRDVNQTMLEENRGKLTDIEYRRAKHIIGENERVVLAVEALKANDIAKVGRLMLESHSSSINYFENSSPEINYLVSIASSLDGCYGARLTGGGFGGATINLVAEDKVADFGRDIICSYKNQYGFSPEIFVTKPGNGAK